MQPQGTNKRIGFVDYDLNNFHADVFLQSIRGPLSSRGFEIAGTTALQEAPSREWAQANNVEYFSTVDALNEVVDSYMILAPSHPQVHLELCNRVFPMGKPTYVDKPFARDLATSQRIFEMADRHNVAVQTSSALRYTQVQQVAQESVPSVRHMVVWAGGTTFEEYGIHPIELAVSCMGPGALALTSVGDEKHPVIVIRFTHGRTATIDFNVGTHVDYAATLTTATGTQYIPVDLTSLFVDTASAILDFLESGQSDIERKQTLTVRAILDAISNRHARTGFIPVVESLASELSGPVTI